MFLPPPPSRFLYVLVFIGQSLSAIAQPCFVNSPGLLAANWFGQSERDVAVTVASLFAVVGNAVGQVLPPMMVNQHAEAVSPASSGGGVNPLIVDGMKSLLLVQAVVAAAAYLLVFVFFKSHPPTPPSSSTAARDLAKQSARALAKSLVGQNPSASNLLSVSGVGDGASPPPAEWWGPRHSLESSVT